MDTILNYALRIVHQGSDKDIAAVVEHAEYLKARKPGGKRHYQDFYAALRHNELTLSPRQQDAVAEQVARLTAERVR
jgi:hypothetical protein